ncbi:hypothetical protein FJ701_27315 [Klebsiella pneumoniae]|nr:hypothetical protein FJ701_27315 [Klebsiella pneumoniae]
MDTELTPTQMAIEFLRRDTTVMSGLASGYPLSHSRWTVTGAANGPFFVPGWQQAKKSPARRGKMSGSG